MPTGKRRGGAAGVTASGSASAEASTAGQQGRKARREGISAWPWWLWAGGGLALLTVAGRFFLGTPPAALNDDSGQRQRSKAPTETKQASPSRAAGKAAGKSSGKGDTMRYLELAMRLQEMTQLATELQQSGLLDEDAASTLDKELSAIELEVEGAEGSVPRDLRSMVSVIRGTMAQKSKNLSDEEVAKLERSYTYANPEYWDDYYNKTEEGERFDWYGSWDSEIREVSFTPGGAAAALRASRLGDLLRPYVDPESKILMLGCGNSDMSEKMYALGMEHITNVDVSEGLLEKLRARLSASMPRMSWQYENASALTFGSETFDVTLDKGTFDAIEQNEQLLADAVAEAHRTLRPGGVLLSVSFNGREARVERQLRKDVLWSECYTHPFEKPSRNGEKSEYFVHACGRA
eukprot:TRINITY_DN26571_c0_g1_i1.p1 TRINITY_DN26571_c0_g1~~TRINITY_DN26571_c0_g1_i1.p1  ORF type:complete len:419 (+),score=104.06 TRINITY_DN26571_c0_g1_i1:38-1258(+)